MIQLLFLSSLDPYSWDSLHAFKEGRKPQGYKHLVYFHVISYVSRFILEV